MAVMHKAGTIFLGKCFNKKCKSCYINTTSHLSKITLISAVHLVRNPNVQPNPRTEEHPAPSQHKIPAIVPRAVEAKTAEPNPIQPTNFGKLATLLKGGKPSHALHA